MKLTEAQVEHLQSLSRNGKLRADEVIEDAQEVGSPLHPLFEWDVERAAYEHWLYTAREIIRSVEIKITTTRVEIMVPRYVPDPDRAPNRPGYMETELIKDDAARAAESLLVELGRAIGVVQRVYRLAAAYELHEAKAAAALKNLTDIVSELHPPPVVPSVNGASAAHH